MKECQHNTISFIVVNSVLLGAECLECGMKWRVEEIAYILQLESSLQNQSSKKYIQ